MSTQEEPPSGGSSQPAIFDEDTPLWRYVTKVAKMGKGGGNVQSQCHYCSKMITGSYPRIKAHLLKIKAAGVKPCEKVTDAHLQEMKTLSGQADARALKSKFRGPCLPTSIHSSEGSTMDMSMDTSHWEIFHDIVVPKLKKRKGERGDLEKSFKGRERELLNSEIARMFYTGGLPFVFAKNPYYISSYKRATSTPIPGYIPPTYNALRTSLLQKEKHNVENNLKHIRDKWVEKGVSVCSDGWSDSHRRPLINVMAACSIGPMFLKAVNCQGEFKDKGYIANLLIESINQIGPMNVVQVITDNAPVCKAAGLLVEAKFKHIFWTPCVVHTLNLALKGICAPSSSERNSQVYLECCWIKNVSDDAMSIKNFIMNHSMRLAMFNAHCKLKLLSLAETRFASSIVMLKRFKALKQGLKQMVISENWDLYREDDVLKARNVKEKILDDSFWDDIDYILDFTAPIYNMIRKADTDEPCLHLIYEWWDSMIEEVKMSIYRKESKEHNENSEFYDVVYEILVARWTKSLTPLHCLAHSLNPRYYSKDWIDQSPNRVAPHQDIEISTERKKCLGRFFGDDDVRRKVNEEYASFSACMDDFACSESMRDRGQMSPIKWWICHGSSTPNLQSIALKLLGQPSSSSCCERNWSTYNFIHSLKRNKITPQRTEDLVYVHTNLRLLSRKESHYIQGESFMWDVGGDGFDSMDGAGMLEIANLSLDEPELERVVFNHEVDDI